MERPHALQGLAGSMHLVERALGPDHPLVAHILLHQARLLRQQQQHHQVGSPYTVPCLSDSARGRQLLEFEPQNCYEAKDVMIDGLIIATQVDPYHNQLSDGYTNPKYQSDVHQLLHGSGYYALIVRCTDPSG